MISAKKLRDEGLTLQHIGRILNRTHSTIHDYLDRYENLARYDKKFREMIKVYEENDQMAINPRIVDAKKVVEVCKSELGLSKQSKFWQIINALGITL